ncbi:MAG: hypothetical protein U0836_17700 [Pirellulales bacterium]
MTSASLASRIGAVALCVGLSAVPWLHVFGDCPGDASNICGTEAYSSDCPCAPSGGYKDCASFTTKAACQANGGHDVKNGFWSCKSGSKSQQCIYGTNKLCWKKYACFWYSTLGECGRNAEQVLDEASYVDKKSVPCGSGSGSG